MRHDTSSTLEALTFKGAAYHQKPYLVVLGCTGNKYRTVCCVVPCKVPATKTLEYAISFLPVSGTRRTGRVSFWLPAALQSCKRENDENRR